MLQDGPPPAVRVPSGSDQLPWAHRSWLWEEPLGSESWALGHWPVVWQAQKGAGQTPILQPTRSWTDGRGQQLVWGPPRGLSKLRTVGCCPGACCCPSAARSDIRASDPLALEHFECTTKYVLGGSELKPGASTQPACPPPLPSYGGEHAPAPPPDYLEAESRRGVIYR